MIYRYRRERVQSKSNQILRHAINRYSPRIPGYRFQAQERVKNQLSHPEPILYTFLRRSSFFDPFPQGFEKDTNKGNFANGKKSLKNVHAYTMVPVRNKIILYVVIMVYARKSFLSFPKETFRDSDIDISL